MKNNNSYLLKKEREIGNYLVYIVLWSIWVHPQFLVGVHIAQSLVLGVVFCRSLLVKPVYPPTTSLRGGIIMVAVDYAFVVHTHTYELAHKYYIIMDTQ
jgi:hypothetical protein